MGYCFVLSCMQSEILSGYGNGLPSAHKLASSHRTYASAVRQATDPSGQDEIVHWGNFCGSVQLVSCLADCLTTSAILSSKAERLTHLSNSL